MSVIEFKDVVKSYKIGNSKLVALKNVNLRIDKGEFVAIMGPSGSGKSTFLHLAGCLDKSDSGEVRVFGKNIRKLSDNKLAELRGKKIGFVFQLYYLIPTLTALENVELPMIFRGIPKKKRIKRAKELLDLVGLGDRLYHRPSELSGGQQQRVAIARALANDPDLILADEPTGALDAESAKIVMDLFTRLNREYGKTVVIVTHDIRIGKYVDRIVVLKNGEIVADGVSVEEALEILKK